MLTHTKSLRQGHGAPVSSCPAKLPEFWALKLERLQCLYLYSSMIELLYYGFENQICVADRIETGGSS
jgi:hypothetical protein